MCAYFSDDFKIFFFFFFFLKKCFFGKTICRNFSFFLLFFYCLSISQLYLIDFEPNGIPFGSKSKRKLSPRSHPSQCGRKWKHSFLGTKENCHHDHIPFNVKGNGNPVFSVQRKTVTTVTSHSMRKEMETWFSRCKGKLSLRSHPIQCEGNGNIVFSVQ